VFPVDEAVVSEPDIARYAEPVLAGSRSGIARAITLVESSRPDHRLLAQHVLNRLLPHADRARRVGVTGVPGVGKSTFIDALGGLLIDRGHRVAVLAVDPSSTRSGGSILGDKTRMTRLAADPDAFVRPSPARPGSHWSSWPPPATTSCWSRPSAWASPRPWWRR
jgi:LAO/AO transport system kinase